MRKPRALRPGDRVGIVAISAAVHGPDRIGRASRAVEEMGFRPVFDPCCFLRRGYLAGTDAERADGLNRMLRDPEIRAVLCLRGGYGAARILDAIDYPALLANPKLILGYSDVTALHAAIDRECGLITLHGPMPLTWPEIDPLALRALFRALTVPEPLGEFPWPERSARRRLVPGVCRGRLAGGNLSVMASLCGTPWQIDARGKILLIEEVNEPAYRVDSMFTQLKNAGLFRDCAGVALGAFARCRDGEREFCCDSLARELLSEAGKPVLAGLSFGHIAKNFAIPLGAMCEMNAETQSLRVLESALQETREG